MAAPQSFVNREFATRTHPRKRLWRYALAGALTAGLLGTAGIGAAQQTAPANAPALVQPTRKEHRRELRSFGRYLDRHPKLARQLQHDPTLANNPAFLAKHSGFQKYLNAHPQITARLQQDPQAFMKQHARWEKHEHHGTKHQKA